MFEVKCSFRIVKARKQLAKIKKMLNESRNYERIRTFFYCGESSELTIV